MADSHLKERDGRGGAAPRRGIGGKMALFALVAAAWVGLDVVTKGFFHACDPGQVVAGPFWGLFRFRLVHNTGAAWGMFGDSTLALGVLSLAVCAVLLAAAFFFAPRLNRLQMLGSALVFAGGIGNAIDRFTLGYVVDFIEAVFIDFPVFNVADIGVTCGFFLIVLGFALGERASAREREALG